MKRIEAIIRPESLEPVKEALIGLGHAGLTVTEVKGHGIQKGITQHWRGQEYSIDLLPKVSIVAVVNDHEVSDVIESITSAARTDRIGDGKILADPAPHLKRCAENDLRTARGSPSTGGFSVAVGRMSGPVRPHQRDIQELMPEFPAGRDTFKD